MTEAILTICVLCEELLRTPDIRDGKQSHMTDAEVMTVVPKAARFFGGHIGNTRVFPEEQGYASRMPGESRPDRRTDALPESVWLALSDILAETSESSDTGQESVIGSFPVPVCDNIRISRSEILMGEEHRGSVPGRRRYFFGIRVHMIVTASGEPVGFVIAPGRPADITISEQTDIALPSDSQLCGDKGSDDYDNEDMPEESDHIILRPIRKKNSVRATDSA